MCVCVFPSEIQQKMKCVEPKKTALCQHVDCSSGNNTKMKSRHTPKKLGTPKMHGITWEIIQNANSTLSDKKGTLQI